MKHSTYLGRCLAAAVGVLALSGAGMAAATTPRSEPPDDTTMGTSDATTGGSEPTTGAGPSDCPPIMEAPAESEAPAGTEAGAATEAPPATEAPAATDATGDTEMAAGTEPAASEPTAASEAPTASAGDTMAPADSMAAVEGPFVQIAESDEYGPILVDSQCRTLYGFTNDVDGEPTCVDDCAATWPPLFVPDEAVPPLADELDPSLFSVVEHPEGPMLKVGDWPLYYFAADTGPGDTQGQGVGGVWWVVAPDGTPIESAAEGTEGSEAPADTAATEGTMPADTDGPATTG